MRRAIHLILDWDGTLTRKDSLALVGQIAYHCNLHQHKPKTLPPWSDFVSAYINDYSQHSAHYKPEAVSRTTLDQERTWLASLTPIEHRSVQRVEASNIFKGVTTNHVDHVASTSINNAELQLRDSWAFLFQNLLHATGQFPAHKISILSVNWSARFIRQSLLAAAAITHDLTTTTHRESLTAYINTMEIRANEISNLDSSTGSDGKLTRPSSSPTSDVRTSADKLSNMPLSHVNNLDVPLSQRAEGDYTVVYVGDSATDLEALLAADVGICIRDVSMGSSQRELAETLERIGVLAVNVDQEGIERRQSTNDGQRVVYWTNGLRQIATALLAMD